MLLDINYDDLCDFIADADEFTYGSAVWLLRTSTIIVVMQDKHGAVRTVLA